MHLVHYIEIPAQAATLIYNSLSLSLSLSLFWKASKKIPLSILFYSISLDRVSMWFLVHLQILLRCWLALEPLIWRSPTKKAACRRRWFWNVGEDLAVCSGWPQVGQGCLECPLCRQFHSQIAQVRQDPRFRTVIGGDWLTPPQQFTIKPFFPNFLFEVLVSPK
jgi:hypothetical protein